MLRSCSEAILPTRFQVFSFLAIVQILSIKKLRYVFARSRGSSGDFCGSSAALRESSGDFCGSSADLRESSVPDNEPPVPENDSSAPGNASSVPVNESSVPCNEPSVAISQRAQPQTKPPLPQSQLVLCQKRREFVGRGHGERINHELRRTYKGANNELVRIGEDLWQRSAQILPQK